VVEGMAVYADHTLLDSALVEATVVMGVLFDPASDGVEWISRFLEERADLRGRLLLSVYPACCTTRHDLEQLLTLQQALSDRAEFRLVLHDHAPAGQGNFIYLLQGADREAVVAVGPTPPFNPAQARDKQVNVVFRAPPLLQDGWLNWFERAWWTAVPLTRDFADVPALIPAQGSPEAAQLWSQYLQRCRPPTTAATADATMHVDAETGRVQVRQDRLMSLPLAMYCMTRSVICSISGCDMPTNRQTWFIAGNQRTIRSWPMRSGKIRALASGLRKGGRRQNRMH
jgi:hypothetical protein